MRFRGREYGFGRRRVFADRPRWRGGPRDLDSPLRRQRVGFAWVPILLMIWLMIGAIAAGQRGYFSGGEENCASIATTIVTIIAGPLNYVGVNPTVENCHANLPQPSQ